MPATDPPATTTRGYPVAGGPPSVTLGVPLAGVEARIGPSPEDRSGSPAPAEFQAAAAAARRWLAVGRDVLLVGDTGSGRSAVLREFAQHALQRGVHVLSLAAPGSADDGRTLEALRAHDLVSRTAQARDASAHLLEAVFADELRGTQNVLAVDDLDRFDPASLAVVERLLGRPGVRLLASVGRDHVRDPAGADLRALAGRVPAEVRIAPLGFWGMSSLLRSHLGGPPDSGLISSVVSRSAGIPGVAVALADAGRFSGVVQRVGGLWTETRPLDHAPHEIVALALAGTGTPEMVDALELLAWTGPLPVPDALRLVGPAVLTRLGDGERVTTYRAGRGPMVTITPPALARALRGRLTEMRRQVLAEQYGAALDEARAPAPAAPGGVTDGPLLLRAAEDHDPRAAAELSGLVHARAAARDEELTALWRAAPTVPHAVHLLDSLAGRPRSEDLDEVFARTVVSPTDPPGALVRFRMHQAQWTLWRTGDLAAATALLGRHADRLGVVGQVLQRQAMLLTVGREGAAPDRDPVAELTNDADEGVARRWTVLAQVALLIERGRPDAALDRLDAWGATDRSEPVGRALEASRSDALLLLGRYEEAEAWSRDRLAAGYEALDPQAIRVHSLKLAECLFLTGRQRAAWQVLSASLRLGPPNPLGAPYHEHTLALGVVIQAQAGDLALAQVLQQELDDLPTTYRPALGSMREWAAATVLYAQGDPQAAEQLLWDTALRAREQGMYTSAALCLAARRSPYPAQSVDVLADVMSHAPVVLFDPLAALHLAIAHRDHQAIVRALERAGSGLVPDLVLAALEVLQQSRRSAGLPALGPAELEQLTSGGAAERFGPGVGPGPDERQRLTNREREVAVLARAGATNREIADRLSVSVRTVENHVYRALRKLSLGTRADLASWDPHTPDQEGARTWAS